MSKQLPAVPSLEQLKKQAKDLRKASVVGDALALARIRSVPELKNHAAGAGLSAAEAQLAIAREYGFDSWPKLKHHVEAANLAASDKLLALIEASLSTSPSNNRSGDFETARGLLAANPALSSQDLFVACLTGDADTADRLLTRDPGLVKQKGGLRNREPLLYLCFSRFLRHDPERAPGMLKIARRLLELGADPNANYVDNDHPKDPQTALYGASGINNNSELTRLLLDAGAEPNDTESLYHASEWHDNACLKLLLDAKPRPDWVSYCLAHKLDFEDYDGVELYLDHGADVNFITPFGERWTRLHHAIERGRSARVVELLLKRGDLTIRDARGHTPYGLAVRLGRTEVADLLRKHGASDAELTETDRFLGACAVGDENRIRAALAREPQLMTTLTAHDCWVLTDAATYGRIDTVRAMLTAGFAPEWTDTDGATALHRAAFSGHSAVVKLLLDHRAPLEVRDTEYHSTPLQWALAGTVKQPWTNAQGDYAGVVEALLAAGAKVPDKSSGRADVLAVLHAHTQKKE